MPVDITIICVTRHGHATTAATLESLPGSTRVPFRLVYADIASPPPVRDYLAGLAATWADVTHLRFDAPVSRQAARIAALETVDTPLVVLLDNNMLCQPGWLEALLAAREKAGASMVSPVIVTHGGRVHFSDGRRELRRSLRSLGKKVVLRPHGQPAAPVRALLTQCSPRAIDIDFAESHCCLATTADLRLPGVLDERMANAHTTCYAAYKLKRDYGKRLVLEPTAVASIVPIGFGYDLPWICRGYLRPDLIATSYRLLEDLFGKGPGTNAHVGALWHAKHLKYLLFSMLEGNRLARQDLLSLDEIPAFIEGYDMPLPRDTDTRIQAEILPWAAQQYPELVDPLAQWLGESLPV